MCIRDRMSTGLSFSQFKIFGSLARTEFTFQVATFILFFPEVDQIEKEVPQPQEEDALGFVT